MALNPRQILVELNRLAAGRRFCLAYSGGIDSHVLLHILATAVPALPVFRVIHINHGLNSDSVRWAEHCADICHEFGIAFKTMDVNVSDIETLGLEAAARQARYQSFKAELADDEVLLTAQHQQDQAETLFLQLLRGAGPKGLSAMWPETVVHGLSILRPLLCVAKDDIRHYAELHQLDWVDDPSNNDTQIKRNFLRQVVWPDLRQHWPAIDKTLSRSAEHCREATILLRDLAELDATTAVVAEGQLSLSELMSLSPERQRNLLRYVIEKQQLSLPSTIVLQRILNELCLAATDKLPEVTWPGAVVRRYRDVIYIGPEQALTSLPAEQRLSGMTDIELASGITLTWRRTTGKGLKLSVVDDGLMLRYRLGGEQIRLQGQAHRKALKTLFQEWGVPPWQRAQIPLLFSGSELVAVVGFAYAEAYAAGADELGCLPSVIKLN